MNRFELQAKLWFWWPMIAFTLMFTLLAGILWFFWPQAERAQAGTETAEIQTAAYGSIEELADYATFRSAYLLANGGSEQLEALQSVQARGTFTSGGQSVPFRSLKRRPNQSLTILKFPDYDLTFGVDGDVIWQRVQVEGQEPSHELKKGTEAETLQQLGEFFDPIMNVILFDKGRKEGLSVATWETKRGESKPALRLDFQAEDGMQAAAYIDPETMQPMARVESFANGTERKILYSNYKTIGGMQEPFLVETYVDGELTSRIEVEKSDHNVGTIASIFEYPG